MTAYRKFCQEDHTGPAELTYPENKIGSPWTGYGAFSLFVADGYGEDQTTLDAIAALNATFRADFDTFQAEADGIYEWMLALHTIGPGGEFETKAALRAERDAKTARAVEIFAEITGKWNALGDTIRDMVSDEHYADFIAACGDI